MLKEKLKNQSKPRVGKRETIVDGGNQGICVKEER
jgi:hypothetical protein